MRICITTPAAPAHGIGGMQDSTADLAFGLTQRGHEVHVVTARHPKGISQQTLFGATWHYLSEPANRINIPRRNRRWSCQVAEHIDALHREAPLDVVHSESTSALVYAAKTTPKGPPVVVKFHGNYFGQVQSLLSSACREKTLSSKVEHIKSTLTLSSMHFLTRGNLFSFRSCHAIILAAQQVNNTCLSHRLDRSKLHVIPNGIDIDKWKPHPIGASRRWLGIQPEKPLFVSAGRLAQDKGFEYAIDAIGTVCQHLPGATLVIIGDGPWLETLQMRARERGVSDRVTFLGSLPHTELLRWLNAADAFLFPTIRDEACPLMLLQALASGCPVIGSHYGVVPEIVNAQDGNGILVEPRSGTALATQMLRLTANPVLAASLRHGARRRALDDYSLASMIDRTIDVYHRAIVDHQCASH